jgi:hypothetical protein
MLKNRRFPTDFPVNLRGSAIFDLPSRTGPPPRLGDWSLFRSDGIGTGLYLFVLTRFLYAKRLKTL